MEIIVVAHGDDLFEDFARILRGSGSSVPRNQAGVTMTYFFRNERTVFCRLFFITLDYFIYLNHAHDPRAAGFES